MKSEAAGNKLIAYATKKRLIENEGREFALDSLRALIPSSLSPDAQEELMQLLLKNVDIDIPCLRGKKPLGKVQYEYVTLVAVIALLGGIAGFLHFRYNLNYDLIISIVGSHYGTLAALGTVQRFAPIEKTIYKREFERRAKNIRSLEPFIRNEFGVDIFKPNKSVPNYTPLYRP